VGRVIHPLIAELRRAWLDSDLTLAMIAKRMGIRAPQAVAQLLNGSVDPRMSTATRLADALGYDLALIPREDA
jgi:predicted transcriptional regulator